MKTKIGIAAALFAAFALTALSQGPPPGGPGRHGFGGPGMGGPFGNDGKVVVNAPYSADMSNQSVQHLADGTTITRTITGKVARDSQGRTYEAFTFTGGGPLGAQGPHTMIFVRDPVAGNAYHLNPQDKTAVEMPLPPQHEGKGSRPTPPDVTETDLPADSSSGVTAEGKQIVHTIPAGQDGNDKAITITSQVWKSADLQIVVKSIRNDPFMGQSTYQLSNVVTKEPDASLFKVPSDYKIVTRSDFHGKQPPPPPPGD